jgi:hypothetical protein
MSRLPARDIPRPRLRGWSRRKAIWPPSEGSMIDKPAPMTRDESGSASGVNISSFTLNHHLQQASIPRGHPVSRGRSSLVTQ